MFRLPALGLAEIAWRWSFGLALYTLLAFSFREYLATLPVTAGETFLLRTRQPALILQAIARILEGSAPRAIATAIVLVLGLTLAWIMLASVGRGAILTSLFEYFRERDGWNGSGQLVVPADPVKHLGSLVGLNFLRAGAMLAAVAGSLGAVFLASAASGADASSPGKALLIFWMLTLLIGLAWSSLNWFLSGAAIFAVGEGRTTFGALGAAADLCWARPGSVTAAAIWFGIAHLLVFMVGSSVAAFPLAFAGVLPAAAVVGGLLLMTLFYLAVVDFLHVGRLAAYVYMAEQPAQSAPQTLGNEPGQGFAFPAPQSEDDILSDLPGLVPPPGTAES